jgi:hypothetical protein
MSMPVLDWWVIRWIMTIMLAHNSLLTSHPREILLKTAKGHKEGEGKDAKENIHRSGRYVAGRECPHALMESGVGEDLRGKSVWPLRHWETASLDE